jgi:CheY-like chemotaxis protein
VSDTGTGISSERLSGLFEPFAQAEQGLSRTHGGLGLGLSLVRGFIEMHGGTVQANSQGPGRGAQFVVSLPLVDSLPARRVQPLLRPPPRFVVVIEDNTDAAVMLADLLTMEGHRVEVAADARSGVDLVRRVKPDLVLCDIGLPDRSGYDVAGELRADPMLRGTRVVALSGYAQPEDRSESRAAGFDAHLAKPLSLEELDALLRSAPPAGA